MFDIQYACCMIVIVVGVIVTRMLGRIMNAEPPYDTAKLQDAKSKSDGRPNRKNKKSSRQNKGHKKAKQEKQNPSDKEAETSDYIRDLTDNTCSKIGIDIIRGLGVKFSNRYNARFSDKLWSTRKQ